MDQVYFAAWLMRAANAFKTEDAAWAVLLLTSMVCVYLLLSSPHQWQAVFVFKWLCFCHIHREWSVLQPPEYIEQLDYIKKAS